MCVRLRLVAKNHSLFDERPQQEFLVAADALKRQLSALNRSLQELKTSTTSSINQSHQSLQHSQAGNKTATEHQKALLLILQTWIAQGFKALEGINEQRNEVSLAWFGIGADLI